MNTGALHIGTRETCRIFLQNASGSYVYILRRPDRRPFYIGKGGGGQNRYRVFDHEKEARCNQNGPRANAYKLNVIRSVIHSGGSIVYEIDSFFEDELAAYEREASLIAHYRRLREGGPLTNLAPGGGTLYGISPESREKHSATLCGIPDNNHERATLNGFILSIYPPLEKELKSIPLKPLTQYKPRSTIINRPYMDAKPRQACALVASAAANGITFDDACTLPRLVTVEGVEGVIESGVARDILVSKLATIIPADNPKDESFQLTKKQARRVVGLIGIVKCIDLGVLTKQAMDLVGGDGLEPPTLSV